MTDHEDEQQPEVSFADLAAEPADESVRREHEAVDALEDAAGEQETAPSEAGVEDNEPPQQPTISSLLGGGPVTPGDDPVI